MKPLGVGVGVLVGIALGFLLAQTITNESAEVSSESPASSESVVSEGRSERNAEHDDERDADPTERASRVTRSEEAPTESSHARAEQLEEELRHHRTQVRALERERQELVGRPLPSTDDVPSASDARFASSTLSGAFALALQEEEVEGDVEGVDCSEFPCILFARLEGDEEDVEELERSEALSAYQGRCPNASLVGGLRR